MTNNELDKILDDGLSSYSREEPRPGLEDRILDRVRAPRERRTFISLRWAAAVPALACFLLAVTFWSTRDLKPKSRKPAPIISSTAPRPRIGPRVIQTTLTRRRPKHVRLPKREEFPTPKPLTAGERALLAFVARSPKQVEKLFSAANSRASEPLEIKPIYIEPLQSGGE